MTSLGFAVILQASLALTGTDGYAEAHQAVTQTGRPMLVVVGADWCPACQALEKTVIPQVRQRGLLRRVAFAIVNLDHDRELGQELTAGGPIPQMLMYRKTASGWKMRRLIGNQSVEAVESFINEGLVVDDDAKKSNAEKTSPASGKSSVSDKHSSKDTGLAKMRG